MSWNFNLDMSQHLSKSSLRLLSYLVIAVCLLGILCFQETDSLLYSSHQNIYHANAEYKPKVLP